MNKYTNLGFKFIANNELLANDTNYNELFSNTKTEEFCCINNPRSLYDTFYLENITGKTTNFNIEVLTTIKDDYGQNITILEISFKNQKEKLRMLINSSDYEDFQCFTTIYYCEK